MSNKLKELQQKKKRVELGDDNEEQGTQFLMKAIYGLSNVYEAYQVKEIEGDPDLEEHNAVEGVQLKANKLTPMSEAVGTLLEKLFGFADKENNPNSVPVPPLLDKQGNVIPLPPPQEMGILEHHYEQIVNDANRSASSKNRTSHFNMLDELLQKVALNMENISSSDGDAICGPESFENAKKIEALSNIHSLFHELKSKVPRLGADGKPEKKSVDDINAQFANKWKGTFNKA